MKRILSMVLVFWTVLLACAISAPRSITLNTGNIEKLTDNARADYRASLSVDTAGVPHVAWIGSSEGQYEVYYATREGGNWQIDQVTNSSTEKSDAYLALDSSSRPHIAWTELGAGWDVWYGYWTGSKWIIQKVTDKGASEMSFPVSIALDSADVPHIAFEGRMGLWGVFYVTNKTGSWITETVSHDDDSAPSIAIDPDDVPHIVYLHGHRETQRFRYASRTDGTWTSEDVFAQGIGHSHRRLYIDSFGVPHIVLSALPDNYWNLPNPYENIVLWYANKSDGSWSLSPIQIAPNGVRGEIFLDSERIPYVTWQSDATGNSEIYLVKGWDWQPIQVTKTLIDEYEPSLFIDSSDNIHLAWHNYALVGSDNAEIFYTHSRVPNFSLSPDTGFAATTLVGSGFSPNSTITVTWDETEIPTVPSPLITDSYGKFTAIISVLTQDEVGSHTVNATDGDRNWASATFDVIDMTGPPGPPGDRGPQGPKGDKGDQGDPKEARELSYLVNASTIGVSIIAICLGTVGLLKKKTQT